MNTKLSKSIEWEKASEPETNSTVERSQTFAYTIFSSKQQKLAFGDKRQCLCMTVASGVSKFTVDPWWLGYNSMQHPWCKLPSRWPRRCSSTNTCNLLTFTLRGLCDQVPPVCWSCRSMMASPDVSWVTASFFSDISKTPPWRALWRNNMQITYTNSIL